MSPMPTTDCAVEQPALDPSLDPVEDSQINARPLAFARISKLKGLFFGFTATVTVGLALGSWYVGVRIVAADEIGLKNAAPAPEKTSMAKALWSTVPSSQFYLQVAGFGPKRSADLLSALRTEGLQAQVQAGENAHSYILIGPFPNLADMEREQYKLLLEGVLAADATR
jgi:hypothetical protein